MSVEKRSRGRLTSVITVAVLCGIGLTGGSAILAHAQNRDQTSRTSPSAAARPEHYGLSKPLHRTRGAIRIATYNTLNLFDNVDDPALQGEYDDIKTPSDPKRCAKLAEAIGAIDADVIALQEVESLAALTWFRDTWLKDAGYKYLASLDAGYYRGVECSLMSRIKITDSKVWLNESLDNVKREGPGWASVPAGTHLTFQRGPLMVDLVGDDGYKFTILAVHHKAGREFDFHREAEALRIVDFIEDLEKRDPSRNIIVMGDFNASPFDKSYRVYLQAGMIDTLAHRLWQGDSEEVALYKTHESNRVLDYILLNSAAHRELVIGSQFVFGTPLPPASYDYRTDPFPEGYASDHYPVVIELTPKDVR